MPRNLERRVEILFPVEEESLKQELMHILDVQLRDTLKAHVLMPDGTYEKVDRRGKEALCAQDTFCAEAMALSKNKKEESKGRTFVPKMHHE